MPADPVETREVLDELNLRMTEDIVTLYRGVTDLPPPEFRALLIEGVPEVVDPYLALAADYAATSYEQILPASGYLAITADPIPKERIAGSTQWALRAFGESALSLLAGSMQRALFDSHRDTTMANVGNESGARWARYASATACPFCRMLATRGAVYTSEAAAVKVVGRGKDMSLQERRMRAAGLDRGDRGRFIAGGSGRTRGNQSLGDKYHDRCRCLAVAVRPGESYQPPAYVDEWERQYVAAVLATDGKGQYGAIDTSAVLAHMRANDAAKVAPAAKAGGSGRKPPVKPPTGGQAVSGADEPRRGKIDRSRVPGGLKQHELDSADRLAVFGHDVTFLPAVNDKKNADMLIDGVVWEMKAPTGGTDSIGRNIRAAKRQAPRVVLDISASPLEIDEIIDLAEAARRRYTVETVWIIGRGVNRRLGGD